MNFGSLFLFFIVLVATVSVASSADLPKIKRGCTTNMARTQLTNTPCTPFVFNGEEYNDGCADYYGRYLWCSTGNSWTYCGPCLDDVAKENAEVAKENVVAKVTTPVAKESTEVAKESTEVAKENTEVAKESNEVAKERTEVAKENKGSDEKTETKENTLPKNTEAKTDSVPAASTTEKTEEVPEKTENNPVEVEEPAHDEKEPENVAENKDEKTAEVPAKAATEEPKATAEDKATKKAETPESKTTEPAKESATEEGKDEKETKVEPKNVETPEKEAEVTAQTPEKEATIQTEVAPKSSNKEGPVEPEVVAPKKPSVTTATSECDDEDDCAEGDASGAGLPEKTEEKKTGDTPKLVATEEGATVGGATVEGETKETKEADNTKGDDKNEVKEVVEVDVNFEIEGEEPIIVEGENKGSKKNNQGVSNVFKITIIVCVVFLLTGIVITGIIVKKRLHRDEYLAGREEKGLKIDLDGVKANSHEKITSVDNVA